jgi:hypothetical protein
MTTSIKILLVAAACLCTGAYLLFRELPATPLHWWGWLVPFLLPMPLYFLLSKIELPKGPTPVLEKSFSEKNASLWWDSRLAFIMVGMYFFLLLIVWLGLKSYLYGAEF